jgi:hypothetical protein
MEVPRYKPSNIPDAPLPNVRVNTEAPAEAFGGGQSNQAVFEATGGMARLAEKHFLEEKKKTDDLAVQDVYVKTVQLKNRLVYDPNNGAITKKGKAALGVATDYGQQFDSQADEIEATLTGQDQRDMYKKIRSQQRLDLTTDLQRHTSGEYLKYQDEVLVNGVKTSQDDALLGYERPEADGQVKRGWNQAAVEQSIATQRAFILSHASRNKGMSGEKIKVSIAEAESSTHAKIIQSMIDSGHDATATKYFEANKLGITDGETMARVKKSLEIGTRLGEAQRKTDEIFDKTKNLEEADQMARDITDDPKLREKVQKMVLDRSNLLKNISDQAGKKNYKEAHTDVIKGKGVDQLPIAVQEKLSPEELNNLASLEKKIKDGVLEKESKPIYDKWLRRLADPKTRDEAAKANLTELHLSEGDLRNLQSRQFSILNGDQKGKDELDGVFTRNSVIDKTIGAANITDKGGQDRIALDVETAVKAFKKNSGGKDPNTDELQKMTNRAVVDAIKSGRAVPAKPKEPKESIYDTEVNLRIVSDAIGAQGIKDKKVMNAIESAARDAWNTEKEAGKVLTQDDLKAKVKELAGQYVTQPGILPFGWSDTKKKGAQITIDDVPADFKANMSKALAARKLPVSDRAILHYFLKQQSRKASSGQ